jgi:hypothetical protein
VANIEVLLEQTEFLLVKQIEAKDKCTEMIKGIVLFIEKEMENGAENPEKKEALKKIHLLLNDFIQKITDVSDSDISFLKEQNKVLKDIGKIEDPNKASEVLNLIVDPSEKFVETNQFKKSILDDMKACEVELTNIFDDIKAAIKEDNLMEIEYMLKDIISEYEEKEKGNGSPQEEELSCSEESGCFGCSKGCSAEDETNLFSHINNLDETSESDESDKKDKDVT